MQVADFKKPFLKYGDKRRRVFRKYRKKAGVYFIKENGIIVYVGMSRTCTVTACYRHFYKWTDDYRGLYDCRVSYSDSLDANLYEIAIIHTDRQQAHELERAIISALKPRDNREKYEIHEKPTYNGTADTEEILPY